MGCSHFSNKSELVGGTFYINSECLSSKNEVVKFLSS